MAWPEICFFISLRVALTFVFRGVALLLWPIRPTERVAAFRDLCQTRAALDTVIKRSARVAFQTCIDSKILATLRLISDCMAHLCFGVSFAMHHVYSMWRQFTLKAFPNIDAAFADVTVAHGNGIFAPLRGNRPCPYISCGGIDVKIRLGSIIIVYESFGRGETQRRALIAFFCLYFATDSLAKPIRVSATVIGINCPLYGLY